MTVIARPAQTVQLSDHNHRNNDRRSSGSPMFGDMSWKFLLFALFTAAATSVTQLEEAKPSSAGQIYSIEEVSKHNSKATGVWVIYKDGVFDITKFVANHPGGVDKIMMAAGGDIAPFWNLYRQHFNSAAPMELLSAMRIGSLSPEDVRRMEANHNPADDTDPYSTDPALSPVLKYISRKPINAEPPNSFLTDDWVTPTELWFVRNHHPVVHVPDVSKFNVQIQFERSVAPTSTTAAASSSDGTNDSSAPVVTLQLSVEELKTKFAPVEVVATLQCGGNRRLEMSAKEKTNGKWTFACPRSVQALCSCITAYIRMLLEYYHNTIYAHSTQVPTGTARSPLPVGRARASETCCSPPGSKRRTCMQVNLAHFICGNASQSDLLL